MARPITREELQSFVTRHLTAGGYYEEPLIRVGRADDTLWEEFKRPGAIGGIYRTRTALPHAAGMAAGSEDRHFGLRSLGG